MLMNQARITENGLHPPCPFIGWRPPLSDRPTAGGKPCHDEPTALSWYENHTKKLTGMYCDYEIKSSEKKGIAAFGRPWGRVEVLD
jgi:hypothetical protein